MVLQALANRVSVPKRVRTILAELRTRLKSRRTGESERLSVLKQELDKVQAGMDRLLEAVESGYLPLDGSLQDRVHRHQTRRQDILLEMGAMRREAELPLKTIGASQIDAFSRVLRGKLLGDKAFAKQYLRTLVTLPRFDVHQAMRP